MLYIYNWLVVARENGENEKKNKKEKTRVINTKREKKKRVKTSKKLETCSRQSITSPITNFFFK